MQSHAVYDLSRMPPYFPSESGYSQWLKHVTQGHRLYDSTEI